MIFQEEINIFIGIIQKIRQKAWSLKGNRLRVAPNYLKVRKTLKTINLLGGEQTSKNIPVFTRFPDSECSDFTSSQIMNVDDLYFSVFYIKLTGRTNTKRPEQHSTNTFLCFVNTL